MDDLYLHVEMRDGQRAAIRRSAILCVEESKYHSPRNSDGTYPCGITSLIHINNGPTIETRTPFDTIRKDMT